MSGESLQAETSFISATAADEIYYLETEVEKENYHEKIQKIYVIKQTKQSQIVFATVIFCALCHSESARVANIRANAS